MWVPLLMVGALARAVDELRFVWIALALSLRLAANGGCRGCIPTTIAPVGAAGVSARGDPGNALPGTVLPRHGHAWARLRSTGRRCAASAWRGVGRSCWLQYGKLGSPEGWEWNRARIAELSSSRHARQTPGAGRTTAPSHIEPRTSGSTTARTSTSRQGRSGRARMGFRERFARLLRIISSDRTLSGIVNGDAERAGTGSLLERCKG